MISFDLNHCTEYLLKLLAQESKSEENLKQLLEHNEGAVYLEVAENKYTDKETLKYIWKNYKSMEETRRTFAKNPSIPEDISRELSENCNFNMAICLLNNVGISAECIDIIVEKHMKETIVAELAVDHKNICAKTLIKIALRHEYLTCEVLGTGKVKLTEAD